MRFAFHTGDKQEYDTECGRGRGPWEGRGATQTTKRKRGSRPMATQQLRLTTASTPCRRSYTRRPTCRHQCWRSQLTRCSGGVCLPYPILSLVAHRIVSIPATSVPCERLFSTAGIIVNDLRSSLCLCVVLCGHPSQPAAQCFVLAGSASARYLCHWRYSQ